MEIIESQIISYVVIPLFIFFARISDVSLGTLRIINISKGNKGMATFLSFFEILIWLFAIQQIMQNLNNIYYYLVYAGGFASGTYVGMFIEQKIMKGKMMISIITDEDSAQMIEYLNSLGHKTIKIRAKGDEGKEHFILAIADRKATDQIAEKIDLLLPNSFYYIEDLRLAGENKIPYLRKHGLMSRLELFKKRKADK